MVINITSIVLFFALVALTWILFENMKNDRNRTALHHRFNILIIMFMIYLVALILQIVFSKTSIPSVYFEYIAYIGGMNFPTAIFVVAYVYYFNKPETKLRKLNWLYIIPIILLLMLWTNDFHGLFYKSYSIYLNSSEFGPALQFFTVYSYTLIAISFILIMIASIKKSGFVSVQTALILIGLLCPFITNVLGVFDVGIKATVYYTPILLSVTAICFYFSIFRLKALSIIPITTKTIVDNMTDSFVVISDDGTIADINKTFIEKFSPIIKVNDKDNLFDLVKNSNVVDLKVLKDTIEEAKSKAKVITKELHIERPDYDKYFEIDFQPVLSKDKSEYVGTLLLMRDVTTDKKDMEIIIKNENLVILGELAGGVAHDINTPISAIKSGITMLSSIGNRTDDEKMLLTSMNSCADKIIALTNSLRNQIRNIGSDEATDINVSNVINDIKLILNNELKKNNVSLETDIRDEIHVIGNFTKLSQVITNIVTNAIQAYDGKGGIVKVIVHKDEENAVITVEDHANGIPESVRPYIFKNILTTKGVSGTGFGLYLAFSVIKGAFGGDITFKTVTGKGTIFTITIPTQQ